MELGLNTLATDENFISNSLLIENQDLAEALSCNIVEITERDSYAIPTQPIDTDETIADTIYTMPTILSVRVFVLSDDIVFFERNLYNVQNSNDFFKITSLYSKSYENLKLLSWSADTNSLMLGGRHYILELQNIKQATAHAQNISNLGRVGYSKNANLGTMPTENQNEPRKKSALLQSVEFIKGS